MVDQGEKLTKEAAMVKLFASEVYGLVVDKVLQIHRGMGYKKEAQIERFYRDARVTRMESLRRRLSLWYSGRH